MVLKLMKQYLQIVKKVVDNKYDLLYKNQNKDKIFWKINFFEANAIGDIGHKIITKILDNSNIKRSVHTYGYHDEFDLILYDKHKIEIKTARNSQKNTLQFNGIDPRHNHDYIIFLGLSSENIKYRIARKNDIIWNHSKKGYYIKYCVDGLQKQKKLTKMNPDNNSSHKITFNWKEMLFFDGFLINIKSIDKKFIKI